MKHPLMIRLAVLGLLALLLCIPLLMVRGTIEERAGYRDQARSDIARSWGGPQVLTGPLLVQTYYTPKTVEVWDENLKTFVEKQEQRFHRVVTYPQTLTVQGDVQVEERYRGIHTVPVYRTGLTFSGDLSIPAVPENATDVKQGLVLAISDARGVRAQPALTWGDETVTVEPGTGTALGNGLRAEVAGDPDVSRPFTLLLALGGSDALAIAPLGGSSRIDLTSGWPHPRFTGGYLPESRRVGNDGFEATWRTSRYAATARGTVEQCLHTAECHANPDELVTVELSDPVNVYALTDRASKYGLMFILVVFGVFFVYEALKQLRVHPVQYMLVGLGQALFFLLLLSLSEHVPFALAYAAGAALSVALLTFYVSYVLGSLRRTAGFATLLAAIYGALFVMLSSEDYALLLGSALLLAILAGAMYLTRNLDWYAVERSRTASRESR